MTRQELRERLPGACPCYVPGHASTGCDSTGYDLTRGKDQIVKGILKKAFRPWLLRSARWLVPRSLARSFSNLAALSRMSAWLRSQGPIDCGGDRMALYDRVLRAEGLDAPIDYLEFGVYRGASLRWWCGHVACSEARFYGFDCFEGLPEDWGVARAGTFDVGGKIPAIDDPRLEFVVGLFQDTLRPFLAGHRLERRKVIHMDADLYTSTLYVLSQLAPWIRPGDVIVFDELGSLRMAEHEFRAFEDFCASFRLSVKALGANSLLETFAVKVV